MSCYLVQETDGTSRFTLEDGSGFLLLDDCIPALVAQTAMGDRRLHHEIIRNHPPSDDEEEQLIALILSRL